VSEILVDLGMGMNGTIYIFAKAKLSDRPRSINIVFVSGGFSGRDGRNLILMSCRLSGRGDR
jgi:hypothetical protein